MKRIGITQRVEYVESYSERRNCLDQRWSDFASTLGYFAIPLPNLLPNQVGDLISVFGLDAVLLSGGNSIAAFDPCALDLAPERDAFESMLIKESMERNLPLIGVCRGMQMINTYLGGHLSRISDHVAVRHAINLQMTEFNCPEAVNSYHNWCIPSTMLGKDLRVIAVDNQGNVEAFTHDHKKVLGIMWHPEREKHFSTLDIELIGRFLL